MNAAYDDKELNKRIRHLDSILSDVLDQQAEPEVALTVRQLHQDFTKLNHQAKSDLMKHIFNLIDPLQPEKMSAVVRAFNIYFSLLNIAEESYGLTLRRHHAELGGHYWKGSFHDTLLTFKEIGITSIQLQTLLDELLYLPVMTAHPTEAKRQSIKGALRNISVNHEKLEDKPMIEFLNTIEISDNQNFVEARFPVQYVNRLNLVFRGFCGTVAAGIFGKGDMIMVLPSDKTSRIKSIVTFDGEQEQAFAPMSITLTRTDEIGISRCDVIVGQQQVSRTLFDRFTATIVCKIEQPMTLCWQYLIKQASRSASGSISMIQHHIDVNTLNQKDAKELKLIEIGCCTVAVNAPVVLDSYDLNKSTGSFIAIDLLINITVGAGMINWDTRDEVWLEVSVKERSNRYAQTAAIIALDGSNAWPLAFHLKRRLFDNGHAGTTLEQPNSELADPIKNVLCIGNQPLMIDMAFDCDYHSTDEIYTMLKSRRVIH